MTAAQSLCRSLIDDPKNMVIESLFDQLGIARKIGDATVSELCRDGVLRRHGDCLKVANKALAEGVIAGAGESLSARAPTSFENYVEGRAATAAEADQVQKPNGHDVPRFTDRSAAHRASKGKLNGAAADETALLPVVNLPVFAETRDESHLKTPIAAPGRAESPAKLPEAQPEAPRAATAKPAPPVVDPAPAFVAIFGEYVVIRRCELEELIRAAKVITRWEKTCIHFELPEMATDLAEEFGE